MREQMIYNPGIYQLREDALKRMLDIIYNQKTAQPGDMMTSQQTVQIIKSTVC